MAEIIVVGTSAGGVNALKEILLAMEGSLAVPVIVVIHRLKNVKSRLHEVLQLTTPIRIKEAEDKEPLKKGTVYIAPANYHLLAERDRTLSLNVSEPVNFSRPSIDVTMVSVAEVYGDKTVGIVLTGANDDGSQGLRNICSRGGRVLVQDPQEAQVKVMPQAALRAVPGAGIMTLHELGKYILSLQ